MADVTVTYQGNTIAELSASGTKTIKTGGKFCEADIGLQYVKPSGGGSSVDRGTFTPASNTLTVTLTVTRQIVGLMIIPEAHPYQGAGVRTCGAVLYDSYGTTVQESFGSNAGGSASAFGWGTNAAQVEQNGNTVTITNKNAAGSGHYIAGLTYRWIAW